MEYIAYILILIASIILIAVIIISALNIIYLSTIIFGVWPPSVPTDRRTIKLAIAQLQKYFEKEENFIIYDLGAGYGKFINAFSKAFPKAKIYGVEILYLPYFISKFRFRKNKNIEIIKQDLFNSDISNANAVFCFYCGNIKRLSDKLKSELSENTIVISNNFRLENWQEQEIINIKDVIKYRKLYIYKK